MYMNDDYYTGNNDLTLEELLLCEVYEEMGRSDLAECVKKGRIYHRLIEATDAWDPTSLTDKQMLAILNGVTDAFLGDQAGELPKTMDDWVKQAKLEFKDDPDLPAILELEEKAKPFAVTAVKARKEERERLDAMFAAEEEAKKQAELTKTEAAIGQRIEKVGSGESALEQDATVGDEKNEAATGTEQKGKTVADMLSAGHEGQALAQKLEGSLVAV
jgi:hypothetical protein